MDDKIKINAVTPTRPYAGAESVIKIIDKLIMSHNSDYNTNKYHFIRSAYV